MGEAIPYPHHRFSNQTALNAAMTPPEDDALVGGRNDEQGGIRGRIIIDGSFIVAALQHATPGAHHEAK